MTFDETRRLLNFVDRLRARGLHPNEVRRLALLEVGCRIAPRRTLKGIMAQREEAAEVVFLDPPAGSPEDLARLKDPTRLTEAQRHDVEVAANIARSEADVPGRFPTISDRRRHVQVARAKAFDQNVNRNILAILRQRDT